MELKQLINHDFDELSFMSCFSSKKAKRFLDSQFFVS